MKAPAIPPDEADRLRSLSELGLLDTPREERFDRICRVASRVFNVPIAFVALIDASRQWYKSSLGLDLSQTARDVSFCGHTILENGMLVIPDARKDDRFHDNPLVVGPPHIRLYVGHVLHGPRGGKVGTFCLIDDQPRDFGGADRALFEDFAALVEREINLTGTSKLQEQLLASQKETDRLLRSILPEAVAARLKESKSVVAEEFLESTVLVAMVHDFANLTRSLEPDAEVQLLNRIFCGFDELAELHGIEKIKTFEAAYVATTGLPERRADHLEAMAEFALAMQESIVQLDPQGEQNLNLCIGLDTGPVVAGVIGRSKFSYDIWGDTVDAAWELAHLGAPGCIQVNDTVYQRLEKTFIFETRGEYYLKSKGAFKLHFLKGRREA